MAYKQHAGYTAKFSRPRSTRRAAPIVTVGLCVRGFWESTGIGTQRRGGTHGGDRGRQVGRRSAIGLHGSAHLTHSRTCFTSFHCSPPQSPRRHPRAPLLASRAAPPLQQTSETASKQPNDVCLEDDRTDYPQNCYDNVFAVCSPETCFSAILGHAPPDDSSSCSAPCFTPLILKFDRWPGGSKWPQQLS